LYARKVRPRDQSGSRSCSPRYKGRATAFITPRFTLRLGPARRLRHRRSTVAASGTAAAWVKKLGSTLVILVFSLYRRRAFRVKGDSGLFYYAGQGRLFRARNIALVLVADASRAESGVHGSHVAFQAMCHRSGVPKKEPRVAACDVPEQKTRSGPFVRAHDDSAPGMKSASATIARNPLKAATKRVAQAFSRR